MPPLNRELAATACPWAEELAPVTERVAHILSQAVKNRDVPPEGRFPPNQSLPTPLTQANRSARRQLYKLRPPFGS
jgi:hypothetical protein